jgi:site-specific recombinase XerD
MDPYQLYEKTCKKIRKENAALLDEFAISLGEKALTEKTIQKHRSNADFFINEFLLYEETRVAAEGPEYISDFLGFWFIRKAMWASPATIKENAASLKKFYQFMYGKGKITKLSLDELNQTIKEEMPEWIATVMRYDDPDCDDVW